MNFTDNILAQLSYLRRTQKNVADKLKRMPDGKIRCRKKNGKAYYTIYDSNSQNEIGLSKDPSKRNLYLFKQDLERQLHAIEANIGFLEKINTHYIPINTSVLQWDGVAAQMNSCHPEDRKHLYHGVHYRSKSEAAIAAMLTSYDIPFKYEVRLNLQNKTFYPDFYIKRPRDGKIFIWEHFGKISDKDYQKNFYQKIEDYHNAGIDLWDDLIASFDQIDGGLNMDTIDKLIHLYLL